MFRLFQRIPTYSEYLGRGFHKHYAFRLRYEEQREITTDKALKLGLPKPSSTTSKSPGFLHVPRNYSTQSSRRNRRRLSAHGDIGLVLSIIKRINSPQFALRCITSKPAESGPPHFQTMHFRQPLRRDCIPSTTFVALTSPVQTPNPQNREKVK